MYLARILRDPDPVNDPNAAVGDPPVEPKDDEPKPDPKKAAPSPAAGELDLNAKVTFNGRKISVSELVAAAQYSHELQTSVAAVFAANTPIAEKKQAVANLLSAIGASEEDITNYLSQNFQDSSGNPGGGDPEPDDRITKLEKELKTQKAAALQGKLDGALDQALDKNPTVRVYLDAAKRLGGDAQVEKAKAALRKAIRKETLGRFRLRYAQTGQAVDETWIQPELEAAIPEAVEACGAVIGDPNQIGQAPETDAGIQQYVRTKAVPEPKYDPKKPVGAMDADIEAWVADGLVRDLAGVGAGDSLV